MSEQPEKKIYWTEGVTRKEVLEALSANKYPMLYRRPVRRELVVLYATLTLALVFSPFIANAKVQSYVEGLAFFSLVGLYLTLRFSVRMIADAPTELLDERLVAIRDRTYLIAYRWLSVVLGLAVGLSIGGEFYKDFISAWPVLMGFAATVLGLPSMVLAWRLPSEKPSLPE